MGPLVAPAGTTTVTCLSEVVAGLVDVPLKETEVTPSRYVPFIVMVEPIDPDLGIELILGAATFRLAWAEPLIVCTLIVPEIAELGTVAVIEVLLFLLIVRFWPLS